MKHKDSGPNNPLTINRKHPDFWIANFEYRATEHLIATFSLVIVGHGVFEAPSLVIHNLSIEKNGKQGKYRLRLPTRKSSQSVGIEEDLHFTLGPEAWKVVEREVLILVNKVRRGDDCEEPAKAPRVKILPSSQYSTELLMKPRGRTNEG